MPSLSLIKYKICKVRNEKILSINKLLKRQTVN